MSSRKKTKTHWYRMDLHLHTPASADYQESDITYLDLLRKAEYRGLDIIAFTDHNTVNGYAAMMREIEGLTFLESLKRIQPEELKRLNEYRRLLDKILVLPGFEFTATFGFHILGLFAPSTPIRQIEHLLLSLNVPAGALDAGSSEVGASSDVLSAYQTITEAGGICIAAHANSTHGVAMRGFDFGGQTKIAYTQDRYLHALEVTDLGRKSRESTERFFNGTKFGYTRRMRCIQGSDAHRLNAQAEKGDKANKNANLGVGDRVTEVMLPERTFEALLEMFQGTDFSRTRPYNPTRQPVDYVQAAREEGPSLIQAFHETFSNSVGRLSAIIADVCAFANTNGGTVYVGASAEAKKLAEGIENPAAAVEQLQREIERMITPTLAVEIDTLESQGKTIVRIQVPSGEARPYAIEDNKIYVRDEAETSLAVRDEIVSLVKQGLKLQAEAAPPPPPPAPTQPRRSRRAAAPAPEVPEEPAPEPAGAAEAPTAGVEIIAIEQRGEERYYTMRDLRNGNIVNNVTRASARKLWHYAIKQREGNPVRAEKVQWQGDIGLWVRYQRQGESRCDLVQRDGQTLRVYYGVTDAGMGGQWQIFLTPEEE
jgi:hypothetical protein